MVWQSADQINQALYDMHNVFCQLPIEAEELFAQKMYEYMWHRNNSSIYALRVFKEYYESALRYGVNVKDATILELGAGKPLGAGIFWNFVGARKYTSIDKFTAVNIGELWVERFKTLVDANIFNPDGFQVNSLVETKDGRHVLDKERIELIESAFEDYPLEKKSFSFIYSTAFLEHVSNVRIILEKAYEVLTDNGVMIHSIDLREHHTNLRVVPDKDTSVDFLRYSANEWNKMYPPGSEHYINRLRASDYRELFNQSGFKIIDFVITQKMELDETVYSMVHPQFREYSIEDLGILGVKIISTKG